MANNGDLRSVASMLLGLNFCMYVIVVAIASWATNNAINEGFFIAPGLSFPPQFSPICYSMGNAATGFLAVFSLIAGLVGVVSVLVGIDHIRHWDFDSLPSATSAAAVAWSLTALAMGFAWKEIELQSRNAKLRTAEAFLIILTVTQLVYIAVICGASGKTRR
ncbi:membrane protein PM19L-like [Ipomoea triloba]|uniref:membrane protein PM19L-like n=1 Tax=Ipomoea triloba TaxID=35885 RepID=UPI00125D6165|nr:membrane protein PM19L-like [Ipomoea triloba]